MKRLKKTLFEGRRNHLQVLSDILELCVRRPQAKTYILRNTNTSFKLLEQYLLQLQASNLLELEFETKKYYTTQKGGKFIDMWATLRRMLYPQELNVIMPTKKYENTPRLLMMKRTLKSENTLKIR